MPLEPECRKSVEEFEALGQHSPGVLLAELNGGVEKQNADLNVDGKIVPHKCSGIKDSIKSLTGGCSCYNLAKTLTIFFPCPESRRETRFRSKGLCNLVEAISR